MMPQNKVQLYQIYYRPSMIIFIFNGPPEVLTNSRMHSDKTVPVNSIVEILNLFCPLANRDLASEIKSPKQHNGPETLKH